MDKFSTRYMNYDFFNAIEIFLQTFKITYEYRKDIELLSIDTSTINDNDTRLAYEFLIFNQLDCKDFEWEENE